MNYIYFTFCELLIHYLRIWALGLQVNKGNLQLFTLKRELPAKEWLPMVILRDSSETAAAKEAKTHGEM